MTHTTPPDLLPLLAIRTAGEQVRYIYEHYPAAKVSNGAAMRIAAAVYYPAKLHYIEESSGLVRISATIWYSHASCRTARASAVLEEPTASQSKQGITYTLQVQGSL